MSCSANLVHSDFGNVHVVMRWSLVWNEVSSLEFVSALVDGWICQASVGRMGDTVLFWMSTLVPRK